MHTTNPGTAAMRLTAPAAVVGALAAALTSAPAGAEEIRATTATSHAPGMRAVSAAGRAPQAAVHPAVARPSDYTIQPGDTVSSVAARHGVTTADLLSWNSLGWRSVIFPGQTLRLSPSSAPASAPASPAASGPTATHTVVAGDTVFAIAKKYGTTVSAIMSANGLGGSAIITPGQTLRIAASSTPVTVPVSAVAHTAPPAAAAPVSHTVGAGDTLFAIARKYGTSVSTLLQANGLGAGSIIYPGQALRLTAPAPAPAATNEQRSAALDPTQSAHASHIIRIGRELGVPDRGIAIALATAMVESSMRNLDHGDRDSLGLFQQRPSQGWGTPAQAMDADRSIRVFYGGPADPNGDTTRGLLDIPGWQDMSFTAAAQTVQVSAYPDRYGMWELQANQWLAALR